MSGEATISPGLQWRYLGDGLYASFDGVPRHSAHAARRRRSLGLRSTPRSSSRSSVT